MWRYVRHMTVYVYIFKQETTKRIIKIRQILKCQNVGLVAQKQPVNRKSHAHSDWTPCCQTVTVLDVSISSNLVVC